MTSQTTLALLITLAITIAGFLIVHFLRRRSRENAPPPTIAQGILGRDGDDSSVSSEPIAYATELTIEVAAQCYRLAFGVSRFDYQVFGEHAEVLGFVEEALGNAANKNQYFPRRPLLLPKLLQALNDTESTRQELVRLILEDPTLAGTTLKHANNAFYRMSAQPVESLDRAVVVLGVDGLKALLSTAIMQPVFRLPKGFFERFADIAWELAQGSAACAQAYAQKDGADDPFVAQLLGVLRSLASIVLFRLTLDKYRERPNVLPRPEVFIRVLQLHRHEIAIEIAKTWQLSATSIQALDELRREVSPPQMSALSRAVYYGELASALAITLRHQISSVEAAEGILVEQGLNRELARELLSTAANPEQKA